MEAIKVRLMSVWVFLELVVYAIKSKINPTSLKIGSMVLSIAGTMHAVVFISHLFAILFIPIIVVFLFLIVV